ncbi:MAG: hypothetical protein KAV87_61950, partial [Desulfobacteraceae bacterium]|nr:hypothetical protein [Desulfobacteraceae bacterium]
ERTMLKKISVEFRDTPIDDVLRIMADQADVDIVKSPNVTGNVTATLKSVPLEEALSNILASHSYGYILSENMIRVAPLTELTERPEVLVSRIYRITYADVRQVENTLTKFITARGSISSNEGTSNIIVTDVESRIRAIDTFIEEIDRITPQILVEARIYDITSRDAIDIGIEWQAGRNTTQAAALGSNPTGQTDAFITGTFSGATGKTDTSSGSIRFGWLNKSIDIDTIIRAQQENVNAKLLANPRILVLDNEKAEIRIISEIPYQELTESSDGGTMGTTSFREVGVELVVTAHVTRDDMVRLQLHPKFSVTTGEVVTVVPGGSTFDQPIVDRREANTTLLIRDGQTIVLGGLKKKEVSQQINKIPFLGDLPLVGLLFKFAGERTIWSELVVFITPYIIEEPTLTTTENEQLEETNFDGPPLTYTKAETRKSEL